MTTIVFVMVSVVMIVIVPLPATRLHREAHEHGKTKQ